MKKIVSVLILVFAFTLTTQAQKKRKKMMAKEKLTVEQQATLAIKKMALQLELTDAQQRKLKPLITKQLKERRAQREKMIKAKKMEADQRYERANKMLDKKLAFQKEMKSILNAEQYEKFKKASKRRQMGMKKRMAMKKKKMAVMKKRKLLKEKKHLKEKKEKKHEDHDNDGR